LDCRSQHNHSKYDKEFRVPKKIIAMSAPVEITAESTDENQKPMPAKFSSVFYTGGPLSISGWDLPVVVDLAGLATSKILVANLDHEQKQRVGNFDVVNDGRQLIANGAATAATPARDEVINSARNGYQWQASLEVSPSKVETVAKGKTVEVNGQQISGPVYVTRKGTLKGFAFVSHGADDNTTAAIAATAASSSKGNSMDPKFKAWIEAMGFDADNLTADQIAGLQSTYDGKQGTKKPDVNAGLSGFEAKKAEKSRVDAITDYALRACDSQPHNIDAIKELTQQAIDAKWDLDKFRLELLEASAPQAYTPFTSRRDERLNNRVLEAAICQAGRLVGHEDMFDDQTLQAAQDKFKGNIGLNQLVLMVAALNGYRSEHSSKVSVEAQRAAFGLQNQSTIRASGFSTISISTILSNVANKFLRAGWDSVDMTPLRISGIRSVNDFKQITTTSLIADVEFEKVGPSGEIKHGTMSELTYNNKAETYGRMLAITRTDYVNDDLGAITSVPMKLGRGGGLKLNNIFWTTFLNNSAFFTSGRLNVNTAVADMTIGGLTATETIFMDQTDPNGDPLGLNAAILLVPTPLKVPANTLMKSERVVAGAGAITGDVNPYAGRFRVESSPYMSNSGYTGYSAAAWYMLADPAVLPVIEIVALNGRIEPVVESADAEFNTLGVQMRGYCDIGVALQEYRAGVRADGGAS
jgi:hypothetical protein